MIEYIVEVTVEPQIVEEWVNWMSMEHIPDVMSTGMFLDYSFLRDASTMNVNKFNITYRCSSLKSFRNYQLHFAKEMQSKHSALYSEVTSAQRRIRIVTPIE